MAKRQKIRGFSLMVLLILSALLTEAQFTLNGQLRTRTEVRNGLGNLALKGAKAAVFTSQRTRLIFGYKWDRVTFGASVQDVRVWGQDASSISNADGARLMLHEGWADVTLFNKADTTIRAKSLDLMSIKLGRQELIYDDVRLIGNLDWLQQGRRHDMALLKTVHKGWQVDLGYAFNQNSDAFGVTGTSYVPGNIPAYVKNSVGTLSTTPADLVPLTVSGSMANNSSKTGAPVYSNPQAPMQPTRIINRLQVYMSAGNLTKQNSLHFISMIILENINLIRQQLMEVIFMEEGLQAQEVAICSIIPVPAVAILMV